ncbi:N-acetylglucosamine-6-phosphate deacetylase [Geomicrobium halophilum]|uniref:N-acetylglucosamine-6-phosphate deacetylase n=1 Tax=Geomicrobium halophilum TaxID=549000 RepID=A0A841PXF0_9BACL|nr:N-acetylglucosamine-6-phosphate deacetylase [Geomicrobium halophilum]MBB6451361.1 N-acetylglucosamine-6-phosphate deacetylase [Geomicrobium halophilum]
MDGAETMILYGMKVVTRDRTIKNGYLLMESGKIKSVGANLAENDYPGVKRIRYDKDDIAIPGFIDIHIHGGYGVDVMDAEQGVFETLGRQLPSEGTTSYLATTITQAEDQTKRALEHAAFFQGDSGQAELLGIHLEGPFINVKRKGAQPQEHLQNGDVEKFQMFQEASDQNILISTYAPEIPGGDALTKHFNETGVIPSIGHSDATQTEVEDAVKAGAKHVTHLFNGMRGFHHREPGVVGTAFSTESLMTELIVDGLHSVPAAVVAAYRAIGAQNLMLITDSMRAKGLQDGTYDLGGQGVTVENGQAVLADGTLAGSIATMETCFCRMHQFTDAPLHELVKMTSANQAETLGVSERKGAIQPGMDADIVLLNNRWKVKNTWCRGQLAYEDKEW